MLLLRILSCYLRLLCCAVSHSRHPLTTAPTSRAYARQRCTCHWILRKPVCHGTARQIRQAFLQWTFFRRRRGLPPTCCPEDIWFHRTGVEYSNRLLLALVDCSVSRGDSGRYGGVRGVNERCKKGVRLTETKTAKNCSK